MTADNTEYDEDDIYPEDQGYLSDEDDDTDTDYSDDDTTEDYDDDQDADAYDDEDDYDYDYDDTDDGEDYDEDEDDYDDEDDDQDDTDDEDTTADEAEDTTADTDEEDTGFNLEDWPDTDPDGQDEDGDGDTDARDALIRKLRQENAAARVRNREMQEQAVSAVEDTLGEMLGSIANQIGYTGELDPDGIAAFMGQSQKQAAEARRDLAIHKAATALGVDTEALTDSRSFIARIEALDPTEKAYGDAVGAEVRRYAEAHPTAKRQNRAPRSGGDFTATRGTMPTNEMTIEQIAAARRERRR